MILGLEAGLTLADIASTTPRVIMLAVEAYHRRRAWAAWHAGYATTGAVQDPDFDDLLGRKRGPAEMTPDELVAAIRSLPLSGRD